MIKAEGVKDVKLRDGMIMQEIDNQVVLVDGSESVERFNGLIRLNQTAAYVVKLLERETSMEAIVQGLMDKYDVDAKKARSNAEKVIESLKNAGLLEEEP